MYITLKSILLRFKIWLVTQSIVESNINLPHNNYEKEN